MGTVQIRPAVLALDDAATYLSLSSSAFKALVRGDELPRPVQLTAQRVGWRTADLDAWVASRPPSSNLPVRDSGYGRRGKPGRDQPGAEVAAASRAADSL